MTGKEQLQKIKEWIAKAKLKEAVDLLLSYAQSESPTQVNGVIALSSKYYEVAEMARNTIIAQPDYQRIRSQLIIQLLEKVAFFESELGIETAVIAPLDVQSTYKLAIARTKVATVLLEATNGLSIKAIQEKSGLKHRKYLIAVLNELLEAELLKRYKTDGVSLNELTEVGRGVIRKWF